MQHHRHSAARPGPRLLSIARPAAAAALAVVLASLTMRGPATDPAPALDTGGLEPARQAAILSGIEQREYHASLTPEGLQAPNRAHNLRTWFREGGIDVVPRMATDDAPTWSLGWRTTGWGRGGRIAPVRTDGVAPHADGARVTYAFDGLDEWYENRKEGLEQGFTVQARPAGRGPLVVAGRFGGGLRPRLSSDEDAVDLLDAGGARVLRYGGLHVHDAGHRELASHFELEGDDIAIVVDDRDALYPVTIDPLLTSPQWTGEANQNAASFGTSVATAGDVNGDGYSDVIVGAWLYDNGETDEGRAFVYLGSAAGLLLAHSWTAESNQAGSAFGYSVSTAGDVNDDGFSDVIVGAFRYDNGQTDEGRAFVYLGSAAGLSPTAVWTAESNQAGAAYGLSVSTAGDVNGDGFSDVIVGAIAYDNGQTDEGRAYVYLGSAAGPDTGAAWTAESNQASAQFGDSVAPAGDVNGDGYSDVIVGASWFDNGESNEGRAFVYHGSPTGLSPTASWTAESNQALAEFGAAVSTAGDVNGDGFSDVIVGAYGYDNGHMNEGRAFAYHGSATGLGPTHSWSAESNQINARFGFYLGNAGDVNGDGYADVIVGAHEYDNVETQEGRAFVYHGSSTGLSTAVAWMAEPNQNDARFGIAVATAGDVNGDGFSDVVVGADLYDNGEGNEGRAFVYLGSGGEPHPFAVWSPESNQAEARFGAAVASAGDVNGDGFSDVIVGAPSLDNGQTNEGAAYVYYGSAAGPATTPSWSAEGNQAEAQFGYSVASAGDVNGDGYSDVIVGAYRHDNGEEDEGRAYLYLGSAAGLAATPAWFTEFNQEFGYLGSSVASAGDVNGDGFSDVIVGALNYPGGISYYPTGRAFVYHGSSTGLSPSAAWTAESGQGESYFAGSVASAGDVNGDGYSDVIVGCSRYYDPPDYSGRAFVYHGSPSGLTANPVWAVDSNKNESYFGHSVASAGDVNGDGFSDVVVGAPFYCCGRDSIGTGAFVYHGSSGGLGTTAAWNLQQAQVRPDFGYSVASAGDVNGDGFSDVIVGAPRFDVTSEDNGRAFLYFGSPVGLSIQQAWGAQSIQFDAELGNAVAGAGDVNGDGFADVIVGTHRYDNGQVDEGRAAVYLGNGGGRTVLPRQLRTTGVPIVAPDGRSNSASEFELRATLVSLYGRTNLQLEYEVKPYGSPLDGSGTGLGGMIDTGNDGALDVARQIFGLTGDTRYHWRVRARYDMVKTPFQPRGPWVRIPLGGWNVASLRTAPATSGVELRPEPGPVARLGPPAPNPFRARSRLDYTLPERGAVTLAIHDVSGRKVLTLVDEVRDAGGHTTTWDGRGEGSKTLPAGVYFARLQFGGRVETRKMVLTP